MSKEDAPIWLFVIGGIAILILAIGIIRFIIGGAVAFFSQEGIWKWLLVIGGIALFVALIMNADKKA